MNPFGYFLCLFAALANGSFVAFAKLESVASCNLHPVLFNMYVGLGVFISCFLAAAFLPLAGADFVITGFGILAGMLFVGASGFSFMAANLLGLSTGQGIWSGAAVVVSFLWGVVGPPPISQPPGSIAGSVIAIILLLCGVLGIVKSEQLGAWAAQLCADDNPAVTVEGIVTAAVEEPPSVALVRATENSVSLEAAGLQSGSASKRRFNGLVAALTVGIFGGSILAPSAFAGPAFTGSRAIAFLPSFGLGVLSLGTAVTGLWYLIQARSANGPPALHLRQTLWAGICSGLVWNLGNVCSLVAISSFGVSFGVAYPLLQSSLVVSGLLGIFVFRELTAKPAIIAFFISAATIVIAAVLLGLYGPGAHAHTALMAPPPLPPASPPLPPSLPPAVPPHPAVPSPPLAPPTDSVEALTETTFTILLLHFIGYVLKRSLRLEQGASIQGGIGYIAGQLALPALNFHSIATLDLRNISRAILLSAVVGKLLLWAACFGVGFATHRHDSSDNRYARAGAIALWAVNSDDVGLGYPLFRSLFPQLASLLFLLASIFVLVLGPMCYVLLGIGQAAAASDGGHSDAAVLSGEGASSAGGRGTSMAKVLLQVSCGLLQNRLVVSAALGLAYNLIFGNVLPWWLSKPTQIMANAFEMLVLLLGGMALVGASTAVDSIRGTALPLALMAIKLILFPLILYALVTSVFDGSESEVNFCFVYGTLPSAASTLFLVSMYGASDRLRQLLAASFAICKAASLVLVFVFAALVTFQSNNQLPRFVSQFSLTLQGLSLAGTAWLLLSSPQLQSWRTNPTKVRVLLLAALELMFPIAFLSVGPDRILGYHPESERRALWVLVSFLRNACEAWLLVLCMDTALRLRRHSAFLSRMSSGQPTNSDMDAIASTVTSRAHILVYASATFALALCTTLPFGMRPYPAHPIIGLWILNRLMAAAYASFYGVATLLFLWCLAVFIRHSSAAPVDAHVLHVGLLCSVGALRSLGQCVLAATLAIKCSADDTAACAMSIQSILAEQLVVMIAIGDGRGMITALLFGMSNEHTQLLRRIAGRCEACVRSPYSRVSSLRITTDGAQGGESAAPSSSDAASVEASAAASASLENGDLAIASVRPSTTAERASLEKFALQHVP